MKKKQSKKKILKKASSLKTNSKAKRIKQPKEQSQKKKRKKSGSTGAYFKGNFELIEFIEKPVVETNDDASVNVISSESHPVVNNTPKQNTPVCLNIHIVQFLEKISTIATSHDLDGKYVSMLVKRAYMDLHMHVIRGGILSVPKAAELLSLGFIKSGNLYMIPVWIFPCISGLELFYEDGSKVLKLENNPRIINGILPYGIKSID